MDDCVTNLSEIGKKWFTDLGSNEILNLQQRHGFAFIATKGKIPCDVHEKRGAI